MAASDVNDRQPELSPCSFKSNTQGSMNGGDGRGCKTEPLGLVAVR
jgi:hypothetical protein